MNSLQRAVPLVRIQAFGAVVHPPELGPGVLLAGAQAQLARGMLDGRHHLLPVDQAAGQLQAGGQHVPREIQQLSGGQVGAQELHTGFVELVRFIEDRDAHRRQQLGHTGFTHRQVGKKQVVVDHHHVGRHGLPAGQVHVAGAKARTWGAQAVFARGSHQRDHGRAFVQPGQFGQVAGARHLGPLLDPGQGAHGNAIGQISLLAGHLHAVQAEVAAPPLEQCRAHGKPQRFNQARQVAAEELVLQSLGRGRQQHALAAQQGRNQVGKGFTDAGAGLDHQGVRAFNGACHGQGHLGLPAPRREMLSRPRQHAAGGKSLFDFKRKRHQAGSGGPATARVERSGHAAAGAAF